MWSKKNRNDLIWPLHHICWSCSTLEKSQGFIQLSQKRKNFGQSTTHNIKARPSGKTPFLQTFHWALWPSKHLIVSRGIKIWKGLGFLWILMIFKCWSSNGVRFTTSGLWIHEFARTAPQTKQTSQIRSRLRSNHEYIKPLIKAIISYI